MPPARTSQGASAKTTNPELPIHTHQQLHGSAVAGRPKAMCAVRAFGLLDVHEPSGNAATALSECTHRIRCNKARDGDVYWAYMSLSGTQLQRILKKF